MRFSGDDLVLQLLTNAGEIGIIACDPDQKMLVIFGMLLCIPQHIRVEDIDLQGCAPIFRIPSEEGFKFCFVSWVSSQCRAEGHGMTGTIRKEVDIILPISFPVRCLAA